MNKNSGMFKGSSMIYALLIAVLVAMLSSSIILLAHYDTQRSQRWLSKERARSNARSAMTMAQAGLLPEEARPYWIDLFQAQQDSVLIDVQQWGLWQKVTCTAGVGEVRSTLTALLGHTSSSTATLELADASGPLHVCGDTRLRGQIRTGTGDVRRGYIEGKTFTGKELVDGSIGQRNGPLPPLDAALAASVRALCAGKPLQREQRVSLIDLSQVPLDDPTRTPTIVLYGNSRIVDLQFASPLIIRCTDTLTIAASCDLQDVLVQAPFVYLEAGSHLCAQVFVSEGIHVGPGVVMHYPSALVGELLEEGTGIHLDEGASIEGIVLAHSAVLENEQQLMITMAPEAVVRGTVYCVGMIQHLGTIHGQLLTNELFLRTASSAYRGYLLDAMIAPFDRPFEHGLALVHTDPIKNVIKWYPSPL